MPLSKDIMESLPTGEKIVIEALFPAEKGNRMQMLQMVTDFNMRAQIPLAILGLFRYRYSISKKERTKRPLDVFQEQLSLNKISKDRLGRLEGESILTTPRDESRGREGWGGGDFY